MKSQENASGDRTLEKWAVRVSLWLGGVSLVLLKCLALWISHSSLVRASMFESLGDVLSSCIMVVTQWRVQDKRDMHQYPLGKRRLTPLGILFFSAFAVSTMSSLAIDSIQQLVAEDPPEALSPGSAIRTMFDEKPHLRRGLRGSQVDEIVQEYSGPEAAEDLGFGKISAMLFGLCIAAKGICLIFCLFADKKASSEIAKTLALDHRNDLICNSMVVIVMVSTKYLKDKGFAWHWLDKTDAASSLLLAVWICRGWLHTAMEQVTYLSNRRADAEITEEVEKQVKAHLANAPFHLVQLDLYHIGEGVEARIEVCLKAEGRGTYPEQLATSLEAVEFVAKSSHEEVKEAQVFLRPQSRLQKTGPDSNWAAGYAAMRT